MLTNMPNGVYARFFFFQAEDGIRDLTVTGVQTCALPILAATTSINGYLRNTPGDVILDLLPLAFDYGLFQVFLAFQARARLVLELGFAFPEIGRASCRERV